jgi:hypothetical protein
MSSEEHGITPYRIERVCNPTFDTEQLSLKEVDDTESVFSRTLVKLEDSGIPDLPAVRTGVEQGGGVDTIPWDLHMLYHYRQDWTPSGYGLGDLVYTTSLLPNEEVTLEVKTWETDRRIEEEEASIDERSLSDIKTTSSNASEVTDRVETKERTYVDAKAGYSGFGFSASVATGWSKDVNTFNQQVARRSRSDTERTTNEQRATRKVKMAVSRERGSESKTTRKLENSNETRTLNANFYQVLKEYAVSHHLERVSLVLLGDEVPINQPVRTERGSGVAFPDWEADDGGNISWGRLIHSIRDPSWIRTFIDRYGRSPVGVLREAWSLPLKEGALVDRPWWKTDAASERERTEFRDRVLRHVRPTTTWVEPDETGALRWGYEVIPGEEADLIRYLLGFLPYSTRQIVGIVLNQGFGHEVAEAAVTGTGARTVRIPETEHIRVPGPFEGIPIEEFQEDGVGDWADRISAMLAEARETVGPIPVTGDDEYTVTVPTQGVYADVTLGVCSGAEDYFEVDREFALRERAERVREERIRNDLRELIHELLEGGEELPDLDDFDGLWDEDGA